jgi:hypothetical protein
MKRTLIAATTLSLAVAGCATTGQTTERNLSAAGFQMKMADTPEKLAEVSKLQQRKVFPTNKDGKVVYVYADAKDCKCIYVGNQEDYKQYANITVTQEVVNSQQMAAANMNMAAMNWGMWGGFRRPIW